MSRQKKRLKCKFILELANAYVCLHNECEFTYRMVEALYYHVSEHFIGAASDISGLHPFDSLSAVHAAAANPSTGITHSEHQIPPTVPNMSNPRPTAPTPLDEDHQNKSICSTCGQSFSRFRDLERHARKHQPEMRIYLCNVQGCEYKGSYRKDKRDAHVKTCHSSVADGEH